MISRDESGRRVVLNTPSAIVRYESNRQFRQLQPDGRINSGAAEMMAAMLSGVHRFRVKQIETKALIAGVRAFYLYVFAKK